MVTEAVSAFQVKADCVVAAGIDGVAGANIT